MTQAQPPAGWYPDPQDATQQRYWDGAAWTGHTASAGASAASPEGAAAVGAQAPDAGAPAWSVPPMAGIEPAKKPWFKRLAFIIPAAIVGAFIVLVVLVAAFGNGTDHSDELADSIRTDGQQQFQAQASAIEPGSTLTVTDVDCVQKGDSQEYTCNIKAALTHTSGEVDNYVGFAEGSCNDKVRARCLWHTTQNFEPAPGE
jgi:hypothetical protein